MDTATRQRLRALIDQRKREAMLAARTAGTSGRWCIGCGVNVSRYTADCLQCNHRRTKRGLRARAGRKAMA